MAKTAMQVTLDEMENLFELPKNTKAETETVIDNSVTGIKTLLDTMTITSQDRRESNQEDLSSHNDNATPPLNKGKAKVKKLWVQDFNN